MTLHLPDIVSVQPVAKIMPVLALDNIGSVPQEIGDRARQFVKGQDYFAHVLAKVGDNTYQVSIESSKDNSAGVKAEALKALLVEMALGTSAKVGQKLLLRLMNNSPLPTFMQVANPSHATENVADISTAANLIAQSLKQAEREGQTTRLQATSVVTQHPNQPQRMAHDLKQAISQSGLFYESHLNHLVSGQQSLSAIQQEPQNQNGTQSASLMSQQLAVLEHQRIAWQGEVWPGQPMSWDIYQTPNEQNAPWASTPEGEDKTIASELTLHLPNLGKVSAKISISNGQMRIHLAAEQSQTLHTLSEQKQALLSAITKNGQQLDVFTLAHAV